MFAFADDRGDFARFITRRKSLLLQLFAVSDHIAFYYTGFLLVHNRVGI